MSVEDVQDDPLHIHLSDTSFVCCLILSQRNYTLTAPFQWLHLVRYTIPSDD